MHVRGHADPDFEGVGRVLEGQIRRYGGGAAVCVYHRGRPVADLWGGSRDPRGHRWQAETPAMSFSTSKGVLATLVHVLADRGRIEIDAPVARYWPEFGQAGKGAISVRELLSHRAGLPQIRPLVDRAERILDWDYMTAALARARPRVRPGRRSAYHAFTWGWLVGELVQRVTGRPLGESLRSELAEPLGLDSLFIGAPPEARARAATLSRPPGGALDRWAGSRGGAVALSRLYRALRVPLDPALMQDALLPVGIEDVLFGPDVLAPPIPAANGLFTARSLARLYAALAGGGSLDGVRLLSRRAVERASRVQTRAPDRVIPLRMDWRLGYHGAFATRGRIEGAFGHFGYGGSGAFADPTRELAVAMVNNRVGGGPFGDARIAFLATAALRGARAARRRRRSRGAVPRGAFA